MVVDRSCNTQQTCKGMSPLDHLCGLHISLKNAHVTRKVSLRLI